MKMRRTVVALFLMVAILTLGIGYAALSDTFTIGANVNTPAFDPEVGFSKWNIGANAQRDGQADNNPEDSVAGDYSIKVYKVNVDDPYTIDTEFTLLEDNINLQVDGYLVAEDDYIIVEFTISNTSAFAINKLAASTASIGTNTHFKAEVSFDGSAYAATATKTTSGNTPALPAISGSTNGTATLYVKITMTQDLEADSVDSVEGGFTITVNADTVAN